MSLLERDDQKPNVVVRSLRAIQYQAEEILIAGVMLAELFCIWYDTAPIRLFVTTIAIIVAVVFFTGAL